MGDVSKGFLGVTCGDGEAAIADDSTGKAVSPSPRNCSRIPEGREEVRCTRVAKTSLSRHPVKGGTASTMSGKQTQTQTQSSSSSYSVPASGKQLTFQDYETDGFYDELMDEQGNPRPGVDVLISRIESLENGELLKRQAAAERALFRMGVTFSVYGDDEGTEKIFPFDIMGRVRTETAD
jgi:hypothetical protein